MSKGTSFPVVASSQELWGALIASAGLEPDGRDTDITIELTELFGRNHKSLEESLGTVPMESLLEGLLTSVASYAHMMTDLLAMFEKAKAQSTTQNLDIRIQFDRLTAPLAFDLNTFRAWRHIFETCIAERQAVVWNHDAARECLRLLENRKEVDQVTRGVDARWLEEYDSGRWPEWEPEITGALPLPIREVWSLWLHVVTRSRSIGIQRVDLQTARTAVQFADLGTLDSSRHEFPTILTCRNLDKQNWAARLLRAFPHVPSASVTTAIEEFVTNQARRDLPVEATLSRLCEVLRLPIWKQRSELYAAWVGSRIIEALGAQVHILSADGHLDFAFGGSHIASMGDGSSQPVHVWAELRTPLDAPSGKGRKHGIQPDYTLAFEPITSPVSSRVVVEVKHYLKQAPKSFGAALDDYARGRPSAEVILVDYGHADEGVIERVGLGKRHRCHVIGHFRPSRDRELTQFKALIKDHVSRPRESNASINVRTEERRERRNVESHQTGTITIELQWDSPFQDLDLHVWFLEAGHEFKHLYHANRVFRNSNRVAELDSDCIGPGREVITLNWAPSSLRCAVHNYSTTGNRGRAKLSMQIATRSFEIECTSIPVRGWWHVWDISEHGDRIIVVDAAVSDRPDPSGSLKEGTSFEKGM